MGYHDRYDDYFLALATAVYAGDLPKARATLDEMRAIGLSSDLIMAARRAVEPLPATPDLAAPIKLPIDFRAPNPFSFTRNDHARRSAPGQARSRA